MTNIMTKRAIIPVLLLTLASCDEPPNNAELCRDVYDALCVRADECGVYTYLNECRAHYYESCRVMRLHDGVNEPTDESAAACVSAIATLDCEGGLDPSTVGACSFLAPLPEDAGADGDGDVDVDADGDVEDTDDAGDNGDTGE
jgi:hypothetical protein